MSPPPVRVEMNARRLPSGEYRGRDSYAGCEMSSRATPPVDGTVQMSPPDTNAISLWSGEIPGSANVGTAAVVPSWEETSATQMARAPRANPMRTSQRDILRLRNRRVDRDARQD